jgi:hypothetical protein
MFFICNNKFTSKIFVEINLIYNLKIYFIMKKVLFTFVATIAFGLFASANTIDVETDKTVKLEVKKEVLEMEEVGQASDCVQYARNRTLSLAANLGMDSSSGSDDFAELMNIFHNLYIGCLHS